MADYDVSFSFQRYYEVLEKLIDNNAQIVIFRAWDISPGDLGHIQDDTWLTTNQITAYGYDGVLYDIDTDEEVGDYSQSSIGFENQEYFKSFGIDNYTDEWKTANDEAKIVVTYNNQDTDTLADIIGFRGDATPAIINNVVDELEDEEILFVFDDDGELQNSKAIVDIIDLKNNRDYYNVNDDRDANQYREINWLDGNHTVLQTRRNRVININNVNQAQFDKDVVAVLDKGHCHIRDNGKQPIEKITVNMYQSAWNYITMGAVMDLQNLDPKIMANEETGTLPIVWFRNPYIGKTLFYIDTTEQENPWLELDNDEYYNWRDFRDFAELNIIPDPEPTPDPPGPGPTPTDPEKAYKKMKELGEGYLFFDEDTANISYILDTMKHDLYDGNGDLVGTDAKLFKK